MGLWGHNIGLSGNYSSAHMSDKVRLSHGLRQLLADDPCSFLLYAVEQVQEQAHYRRLGRVLKRLTRRKEQLGWVHVSDITQECDRIIAARLLGYQLPREKIDPQKSRIFENGTYMHLRFYNYFLSLPPPFEVQVAVELRQWPIVGEADVIVYHPEFDWQVIELKSMNDNQFKMLKSATPSHSAQVNNYVGLLGKGQGQVWYENKNTQDVKTYSLPYLAAAYAEGRQRVLSVSETVLAGRLPPPCGSCGLDDYIGELQGVEERITQLAAVRAANV